MPYTLVVIDMQPYFEAANWPDVLVGVINELHRAIQNKAPILIVEYGHLENVTCPTHAGLLKMLKDYKLKCRVKKMDDDGSNEVLRTAKRRKFPLSFRVCGVNTNCCVLSTVCGLLKKENHIQVEVVKSACGCSEYKNGWRFYPKHRNLKLV